MAAALLAATVLPGITCTFTGACADLGGDWAVGCIDIYRSSRADWCLGSAAVQNMCTTHANHLTKNVWLP